MADLDIAQAQVTDMTNTIDNFEITPAVTDGVADQPETTWDNRNWSVYYGYYNQIPQFKTAINAFATWVLGKGYTADARTEAQLSRITGMGEDTFLSLLWNMLVTKKINGDAYAHIIRNEAGDFINLKPLEPSSMRTIINSKGVIKRYEQTTKNKEPNKKFKTTEIFHIMNDRVADEIHGTSIVDAIRWVIDAMQEAMEDQKTVMHRNVVPLRIIEIDSENTAKATKIKKQYEEAINKKEVIVVPKGNVEIKDSTAVLQDMMPWLKYLENFFYQALGVPKVILGGSSEFTEASSKIGYLTFEVIYTREVSELLADLWNQLAIRIEINKPASLENELLNSEQKNTGQTGFQANDTTAGVGEDGI